MKRSKFSLSHSKLLSCDMGELVPIGLMEVLPGDTVQHSTNALVRAAPLLAPVMHPVDVRIHHWFVPHRLVWEDFEDFITGGPDGLDASVFPTITFPQNGPEVGTLADYLGIPPDNSTGTTEVSALPFRGYALIWNEWYRDQDLQSPKDIDLTDGSDSTTSVDLQNCAWEKDYFTSARPWEQKGPAISIPIGVSAPVSFTAGNVALKNITAGTPAMELGPITSAANKSISGLGGADPGASGNDLGIRREEIAGGTADLTGASAVTVTALREAMALQRFEEARARYGSRYVEYLRYLGVRSSDARLARPEYLGGGRSTIQFSEVLQTSATDGSTPLGELGGHGIAAMRSNRYRRFFEEHGYVFSLMSVRPRTIYTQGLWRTWNRRTKEDFFQRELQHIGQQEILNKEIYAKHAGPNAPFGYQDRYDDYRSMESSVAGEFRTSTLNFWHFARQFGSDPALNDDFVKCVPPETPFAVPSEDVLYIMARHSIQARRLVAGSGSSFIF